MHPNCALLSASPECTSEGENKEEGSYQFRQVSSRKWSSIFLGGGTANITYTTEYNFCFEQTPSGLHHQSDTTVVLLVGNPVKQLVWKNEACVSFFQQHIHTQRQRLFFFLFLLPDISVSFGESIIKGFFSFSFSVSLSVLAILLFGLNWWILMVDYQFSLCNNTCNAVADKSVGQWDEGSVNLLHLHYNSAWNPSLSLLTHHMLNDRWEVKESGEVASEAVRQFPALTAINLPHTTKKTHSDLSLVQTQQFVHCLSFILRQHFAFNGLM